MLLAKAILLYIKIEILIFVILYSSRDQYQQQPNSEKLTNKTNKNDYIITFIREKCHRWIQKLILSLRNNWLY